MLQQLSSMLAKIDGTWCFVIPKDPQLQLLPCEVHHRIAAAYVLEGAAAADAEEEEEVVLSITCCSGHARAAADADSDSLEAMINSNCKGLWRRLEVRQSRELDSQFAADLHNLMRQAVLNDAFWGCYFDQCKFGVLAVASPQRPGNNDLGVVRSILVLESRPGMEAAKMPSACELSSWMARAPQESRILAVYDILAAHVGEEVALVYEEICMDEGEWMHRSQSYSLHRLSICLLLIGACDAMEDGVKEIVVKAIMEMVGRNIQCSSSEGYF